MGSEEFETSPPTSPNTSFLRFLFHPPQQLSSVCSEVKNISKKLYKSGLGCGDAKDAKVLFFSHGFAL